MGGLSFLFLRSRDLSPSSPLAQTSSSFIVCSDITERIIAHLIPSSFNLYTSIQSFLRLRLVSKHFKTDVEHLARLWIRRYLTTRSNSRLCKFISYAPILWSLPGVRPVDWSRVSQDPWNSDSGLWDAESGFRRWLLSLARDVDMVRVCDLLVTRGRQNVPNEAAGRILAMLGFRGKENARMWDRVLQSSVVLLGYGEALVGPNLGFQFVCLSRLTSYCLPDKRGRSQ